MQNNALYITPTYFVDCDHIDIKDKANELTEDLTDEVEIVKALFYYVRDSYYYYPYDVSFYHEKLKASYMLNKKPKRGFCIEKAILFAALCRALNIPNRFVFCNVRNHIATGNVEKVLKTDLLVFHGYNEVFINNKWVKCTVAFNKSLCEKLNVDTLDFDGETDQVFQQFDKKGGKFMHYEHEYGVFHDVPHDLWVSETRRIYAHLFKSQEAMEFLQLNKAKGIIEN